MSWTDKAKYDDLCMDCCGYCGGSCSEFPEVKGGKEEKKV